ncbi:MAG TPA: CdaR family protein [Erysipelotrichaceae bacterium]|nr:CdaR family protein [Erysipelotrichaceae bacterium]
MSQNKKPVEQGYDKLELAKKIAEQSSKVFKTYNSIEFIVMRIVRFFSMWIDRLLFSPHSGKIVSLILAIVLYVAINFNIGEIIFETPITSGVTIDAIPVTVISNDEVYEVSGLPTEVKAYVIGDMSDITLIRTQKAYSVVADLTGLLEGTHEVKLAPKDFSTRVEVALSQSTAVVTIKKKVSQHFNLEYDYINTDKMNQEFVLSDPTFVDQEIIIRASQDTLYKIGIVKALIDASGVTADFTQEAPIVAYDQDGNKMDVDIIPSSVSVSVGVSSPNKTVGIEIVPNGDIPNGKAIESITLDQQTVTIFGKDTVLQNIDTIQVPIDATTLTTDTSLVADIPLPTGVKKTSVSRVNMQITLGDGVSGRVEDVFIQFINNINGYRFTLIDSDDTVTGIDLFGTQSNVDTVTSDDFYVYFDMSKLEPGEQDVQLLMRSYKPLVKASLVKQTIRINVVK